MLSTSQCHWCTQLLCSVGPLSAMLKQPKFIRRSYVTLWCCWWTAVSTCWQVVPGTVWLSTSGSDGRANNVVAELCAVVTSNNQDDNDVEVSCHTVEMTGMWPWPASLSTMRHRFFPPLQPRWKNNACTTTDIVVKMTSMFMPADQFISHVAQ